MLELGIVENVGEKGKGGGGRGRCLCVRVVGKRWGEWRVKMLGKKVRVR